jgi:hypothetical protein
MLPINLIFLNIVHQSFRSEPSSRSIPLVTGIDVLRDRTVEEEESTVIGGDAVGRDRCGGGGELR